MFFRSTYKGGWELQTSVFGVISEASKTSESRGKNIRDRLFEFFMVYKKYKFQNITNPYAPKK